MTKVKTVEMENTNDDPIEIDSNDEEESLFTWPQFKKFMRFKKANENNCLFECKLCIPKVHEIRVHKSSYNKVNSHFQKKHRSRCALVGCSSNIFFSIFEISQSA